MTSVDETDTGNNETATNGAKKEEPQAKIDPPTNLEAQIIRQIEYYFGDANLPRDKFMLEQIKVDDGWIPMSTMLKFQRLAKITTESSLIATALKKSDLIEVDEAGDDPKIRRSPEHPLPELNDERRKEITTRTVYCKGFPLNANLDVLIAAMDQYGPTENIIMRKYKDTITQKFMFKGSIFVTFPSKEKAQEFIDLPSAKYGEIELVRMFAADYSEQKKAEHKSKQKHTANQPSKEAKAEPFNKVLKKGATFKVEGEFKPETSREDIKAALSELGIDVAYIGFNKGDTKAYIRLHEENSAKLALEKMENALTVHDVKLTAQVLEGEEEEKYLEKTKDDMKAFRSKPNRFNKKGGRGKKRGARDDGGPSNKKSR